MAEMNKKNIRDNFRSKVIKRDGNCCLMCGYRPASIDELDAHHICDRSLMPFGGYVPLNGISLCTDRSLNSQNCHAKAESLHSKGFSIEGYTPSDLYDKIGSSYQQAYMLSVENVDENFWHDFENVNFQEDQICREFKCDKNQETWELACEVVTTKDPLIINYGKGRDYAVNNRTKRCN